MEKTQKNPLFFCDGEWGTTQVELSKTDILQSITNIITNYLNLYLRHHVSG
jgi:hypothetical protein